MSFSIAGKTAIVTGAANGVGLAIARQFADQGAHVMLADRDEDRLADEVGQSGSATMRYFAGDLREHLTQANLLSATLDAFDRVDILINAARQFKRSDPLNPAEDQVQELLEQNLMSSLRLSQLVAKRMIKQSEAENREDGQAGAIVNISSIAAHRVHADLLGYAVASAALDQMTRSLAVALAEKRIRVNAVAFGSVMSASLKNTLKDHPDLRSEIVAATPMARIAAPNEVADAAQYLASEGAGFVTGQIMTIDGGRSLIDPVEVAAH